jgi:N6-adenosine-specific RNA methylase IME4
MKQNSEQKVEDILSSPTCGKPIVSCSCGHKKYGIIYADPAWNMGYVKGGLTAGSVKGGEVLPYQTMTDEQIMAMPVKDISADDALLFMWVTDNRIPKVKELMEAWGFKYNSLAFIWNKITKCTTNQIDIFNEIKGEKVRTTLTPYTRRSCEYCFLGTKGSAIGLIQDHYVLQYVAWASRSRKHSEKPDEVRKRIVKLCGDIPRVELFAREQKTGWDVWGNQVQNSIKLNAGNNYS